MSGFGTVPFGTAPFGGTIILPGGGVLVGDLFTETVRSSRIEYVTVTASRAGVALDLDLKPLGGSVVDDSSPGVRRMLSLELAPDPGLFDELAVTGTELAVNSIIRYPSGATETVPMGVFDIDAQKLGYRPDSSLSITAPDKWGRIQRAKFILPQASTPEMLVSDQIADLIRGALGSGEPVANFATSTAVMNAVVWDRDRDKAIIELADSIGAYVSFDRGGTATIEDLPTIGSTSEWLIDATERGVLLTADRERNRQRTYNVVVVNAESTDGTPLFDPVVVWDNDTNSATYAGPDPLNTPQLAGPFGVVPYFFSSPVITTQTEAQQAAYKILYRVTGTAASLSLTAVKNPAINSLDLIDVLPPAEAGRGRFMERHIVDRVTHPLGPDGEQQIQGRSTRTDAYS